MGDGPQLAALLARVAAQDHDALRHLYDATSAKMFGVCLRVCALDRQMAEEALQDSFVKIWRKAGMFDAGRASAITWMCAIARNSAIDLRRSAGSVPSPISQDDGASEWADDSVDMAEELENRSMHHHILNCLKQLDPTHADAVRRAYFEGLTHSELAVRLAVPLGTLKSRIRRALGTLKECIDDGR